MTLTPTGVFSNNNNTSGCVVSMDFLDGNRLGTVHVRTYVGINYLISISFPFVYVLYSMYCYILYISAPY